MSDMLHEIPYDIYILFFGVYTSMRIACGRLNARTWRFFWMLCPLLLLFQGGVLLLFGAQAIRMLYPLVTHLPLIAVLVCAFHARADVAAIAVITSYSLCQLLRWIGLLLDSLPLVPLAVTVLHLALCQLLLLLLNRFFLDAMHHIIAGSSLLRLWFGTMPALYFLFEYFMIWTQHRYYDVPFFHELLPTLMVSFFLLFVAAYYRETERRSQLQSQAAAMKESFQQAEREIAALRAAEESTAIFRHDFRHHLNMLASFLSAAQYDRAGDYIKDAQAALDAITPVRYCENEIVNLLLCTFKARAESKGIALQIRAALPQSLPIPDTELCALLSNALENALNAAAKLSSATRPRIDVHCLIRQENFLFEVRNPYAGDVAMHDGMPMTADGEAHYGCRSIHSIAKRRGGFCSFNAADGLFTLRIAIPIHLNSD